MISAVKCKRGHTCKMVRLSSHGKAAPIRPACWPHSYQRTLQKPLRALPELVHAGSPDDLGAAELVLRTVQADNVGLLGSLTVSHAAVESVLGLFATLKSHLLGSHDFLDSLPLHAMQSAPGVPVAVHLSDSLHQLVQSQQLAQDALPLHGTLQDSLSTAVQHAPVLDQAPAMSMAADLHTTAALPTGDEGTRDSLGSVLDAASQALQSRYQDQEQQIVTAFVLNFNQMLAALHLPFAGGFASFDAMEVTQASLTATTEEAATGMDLVVKVTLAALAIVVAGIPQRVAAALSDDPHAVLPEEYSTEGLEQYFSRKPMKVLRRNAEVLRQVSSFAASLLLDWATGNFTANQALRAEELCQKVEELGPAYVKIAQSMSTRVDMLTPAYLDAFQRLQDRVKPFTNQEARRVLEEGLKLEVDSVFEWLSEAPMAAASLGQVYKGKLQPVHGGHFVAVKVQRPHVLENVSLDIFIMRRAALIFSLMPGMNAEWANSLDGWAERFFQELDYCREARNTMRFAQNVIDYEMEGISVPKVFPQLVSRSVMVTEWVAGEKLTNCSATDVENLCRALLNCYLVQLLETGFLHADPHPGNLMVMPNGNICILDFGLVTEIPEPQRVLMVEYIAHLTTEDWDAVAADLEGFGFFPEGLPEHAMEIITPILAKLMGSLIHGGGIGKTFSFAMVGELDFAARQFQMVVPGYFGLILRAFSTIEGMALCANPEFSMIQECLPYLLRRLLSDSNPRMQQALRALLYGNAKHVDVQRLSKICNTLGLFSKATMSNRSHAMGPTFAEAAGREEMVVGRAQKGSGLGLATPEDTGLVSEKMKDALKVMFQKDGSYAQELLADELVAAVDALSKAALGEALRMVVGSGGAKAAQRHAEALGPLRSLLFPLPLPNDVMSNMQPMVSLSSEDQEVLSQLRLVLDQPSSGGGLPGLSRHAAGLVQVAGELAPLVPDIMPGLQFTLERTSLLLMQRILQRLAGEAHEGGAPSGAAAAAPWRSPGFSQSAGVQAAAPMAGVQAFNSSGSTIAGNGHSEEGKKTPIKFVKL